MSKKITGAEYPLSKIFSSDFDYVIPPYQRPYAWTTDQTSELFDDLYTFFEQESEDSYFLGSIVLKKDEGKPHAEVIDGQQRLTTLTILLASITSRFANELRADFEAYIREPGRASQNLPSKPRLALRERDKEFFAKYIQALDFDSLSKLDSKQLNNESQLNIKENALLLSNRINNKFSNDEEQLCKFGAFIVERCFMVAVSTPSQESAFRVFSVLNSRGLDSFISDTAATYDPSVLTIEHVLPQTVDNNSEWAQAWPNVEERNQWVHRIANLLPLTQKRNSQAQNYDFNKKKSAYFVGSKGVSSYALTTQVLNVPTWCKLDLEKRQQSLLNVFSDKWNLNVEKTES